MRFVSFQPNTTPVQSGCAVVTNISKFIVSYHHLSTERNESAICSNKHHRSIHSTKYHHRGESFERDIEQHEKPVPAHTDETANVHSQVGRGSSIVLSQCSDTLRSYSLWRHKSRRHMDPKLAKIFVHVLDTFLECTQPLVDSYVGESVSSKATKRARFSVSSDSALQSLARGYLS